MVDAADLTIGLSSVITACGAARLGLKVAFMAWWAMMSTAVLC
ncbi:MAG: hypothetical protein M5U34_37865 [Chloroflexi bacterium]|nr:hypothetical protein [Chloroflexota bacterium]